MKIETFLQLYHPRLRAYARRTAKRFGLPRDLVADLEQACVLAAMRELKWWREGAGKSAFNWCAGPMRREMQRTIRREAGMKPNGQDPLPVMADGFDDEAGAGVVETVAEVQARFDTIAEMRRAFATLPRSPHLVRFLAVALSPASGADLARAQGVSRQAICTSVSRTRQLLRASLA